MTLKIQIKIIRILFPQVNDHDSIKCFLPKFFRANK